MKELYKKRQKRLANPPKKQRAKLFAKITFKTLSPSPIFETKTKKIILLLSVRSYAEKNCKNYLTDK